MTGRHAADPGGAATMHDPGPFTHIGLLYQGPEEYAAGCADFVRSARDAGDPVLVAVPGGNGRLIRDRLGTDATGVWFADMAAAGRNPGRIIPGVLLAFAAEHAGRRVSIIGEPIWPGRTEVEYPACAAHEALINAAFAGRDAAILCPYDADNLDPAMVADAALTHPTMADATRTWSSEVYHDPVEVAAGFDRPLPPVPAGAATTTLDGDLAAVRRFAAAGARAAGLSSERVDELVIAVNELATNTSQHAGGGGRLAMWTEPGVLVCQVEDAGRLTDPLAGRIPPARGATGGYGLVLVNQLCDLVRLHTTPSGTTFRLHITLPGP